MKKGVAISILIVSLLSLSFAAADVGLEEKSINSLIIKELPVPAKFEITIKNDNTFDDIFVIDTLLDINILPKDDIAVPSRGEKKVTREVYLSKAIKDSQKGLFAFEYYARGDKSQLKKSYLIVNVVSFSDIITIELPKVVGRDAANIPVKIKLSEPLEYFTELEISSELGSASEEFTLTNEGKVIVLPITQKDPQSGVYELKAKFRINGTEFTETKEFMLESFINVNEETIESGNFLHKVSETTKVNNGNSVTSTTILFRKSFISGMFTSFNAEPTATTKDGGVVTYEFSKDLNPGEKFAVKATTSFYMPLIVLIILGSAISCFIYIITPKVKVSKKAIKVKTKSGVFATKIVVSVENKGKGVTDLKVLERLPAFTELLPDKFGTVSPTAIKKRSLVWAVEGLARGEEVMFSYIVYSKVDILGKLEVPQTIVTFVDAKGHIQEVRSNRLFVLTSELVEPEAVAVPDYQSVPADEL